MVKKIFNEANDTAVFTTIYVINAKKDITYVTHEREDGAWQFFSNDNFTNYEEVAMIVGLGEIIKIDNTLFDLENLPEGFSARRKFKGDKWVISEIK